MASQLPPEMVEAIDAALRRSGHQHRTRVVVEALAPLLAARERALRDRLTDDGAVEALRSHFHTSITPRDARDALAAVVDYLESREGNGRG